MKQFAFFKYSFLILVAGLAFTSCQPEDSADVNQDKIYTEYELFYNSNTDKTQAIARFRFGGPAGTLLELNSPASVKFDGEEIPYNAIYAGHFKEFSGNIQDGTFLYTNVDGTTFENVVPTYEAIAFPATLDSVSKSSSFDLKWEGSALSENQAVGVFIGSWKWGQDALFLEVGDGADKIVLGQNQLGNVQTGSTTFYMDRQTEIEVAEGTEKGGKIRGKFRTTNQTVIVTE